jgi:hypothetical protein
MWKECLKVFHFTDITAFFFYTYGGYELSIRLSIPANSFSTFEKSVQNEFSCFLHIMFDHSKPMVRDDIALNENVSI